MEEKEEAGLEKEVEVPEVDGLEAEILMAIGEKIGPWLEREAGGKKKTLLIIYWQEGLAATGEEAEPEPEQEVGREEKVLSIVR